jgi:hypothetical protein
VHTECHQIVNLLTRYLWHIRTRNCIARAINSPRRFEASLTCIDLLLENVASPIASGEFSFVLSLNSTAIEYVLTITTIVTTVCMICSLNRACILLVLYSVNSQGIIVI